jgi:hypothetical protein
MEMKHVHGHELLTCSFSMGLGDGHGCRNAGMPKKVKSGIVNFPLVYNAWSGIVVIPAALVTE